MDAIANGLHESGYEIEKRVIHAESNAHLNGYEGQLVATTKEVATDRDESQEA